MIGWTQKSSSSAGGDEMHDECLSNKDHKGDGTTASGTKAAAKDRRSQSQAGADEWDRHAQRSKETDEEQDAGRR